MTETGSVRRPGRKRLPALATRRVEIAAALVLVLGCATLVALETGSAMADPDQLAGKPVPAADVETIVAAALSCPTLTPPRVAAQIMAASGFDSEAAETGIAGLDNADWKRWRPSSGAQRTDRQANILALAHRTCELVGQLRKAKVKGDLWAASVGADRAGLSAAIAAKGVPAGAKSYVDKVAAYAQWYARQDPFRVGQTPTPTASAPAGKVTAVPAEYLADVQAAGRLCPTITPVRVAAQLMAASKFDPNLRSGDGAQGIAQFEPRMWAEYRPSSAASVWDPHDAIPVLGATMCDLVDQLTGLDGADPYTLALGAFQWGLDVIRQANGLPRANVAQLSTAVREFVPEYQKDPRLTVKPEPKPTRTQTSKPTATPTPTATTTAPPPPAAAEPFEEGVSYQLENGWSAAIVDLLGDDTNTASGARVDLWQNQRAKDQFWRLQKAPDAGYVVITNAFSGKSLGVENASTDNGAKLVQLDSDPADPNQQWALKDAGAGQWHIINHHSGKAMDLLGDDRTAPMADGTWNGYLVEQWDLQTVAKDQKWLLTR